MDTSIERIRAKIAEMEAKLSNLRIAERELLALETAPAPRTKAAPRLKKRKPKANRPSPARQTIADPGNHGLGVLHSDLDGSSVITQIPLRVRVL